MASTLRRLADDEATALFDLNDETGANNADHGSVHTYLLGDLDLGLVEEQLTTVEPPNFPGGIVTHRRYGPRTATFRMRMSADSYDDLASGFGALAQLLGEPGVLEWQPEGATAPRYIDVLGSSLGSLFRGQDLALYKILRLLDDVDGIPIQLLIQPLLRESDRSSDTNKLKNATLLWEGATGNRPGHWDWLVATNISAESINSSTVGPLPRWWGSYQFNIATTSARSLQQTTAVGSFASGDVVTKSFYVRASAGSVIRARAAVQFKQADGTTNVGSEEVGTLTAIGTTWTRVDVTTPAAGANTSRALVSIRFENSAATDTTVYVAAAQAEIGSSASDFVCGTAIHATNPDGSTDQGLTAFAYIHGDAPAPMWFHIDGLTNGEARFVVARRSGDRGLAAFANGGLVLQCEAATLFGDDTAAAADAAATGAGNNVAATTFATDPTMAARVVFGPFAVDDSRKGTFIPYVLGRKTVGTAVVTLRLGWGAASVAVTSEPVVTFDTNSTAYHLIKLADRIHIPDLGHTTNLFLNLQLARPSGTGSFHCDLILLVPADESVSIADLTTAAPAGGVILDTDDERFYALNASDAIQELVTSGGGGLHVYGQPGLNLFEIIPLRSTSTNEYATLGATYTVGARHGPRRL